MITIWGRNVTFQFYVPLQIFYSLNMPTLLTSLLAGYLIFFKSPTEMKHYKFILANIWFWTSGADVLFSLLIHPQMFLPLLGGTTSNLIWNYLLFEFTDYGWGMWLTSWLFIANASLSLLDGFLYRLWALSMNSWAMNKPKRMIVVLFLVHAINIIPAFVLGILAYTPRWKAEEFIRNEFPEYIDILTLCNFVIIEPKLNPFNAYFLIAEFIGTTWVFGTGGWIMTKIYRVLKKFRSSMSVKTYEQHKMLTISLVVQIAIPILFFYLPVLIGLGYIYQFVNDDRADTTKVRVVSHVLLALFCLHTNLNIISMVYMITPYRNEVRRLLGILKIMKPYEIASQNRISNVPTSSF